MNHLRSVICFIFIIQFFFTNNDLRSQDTNIIKYLPLSVGNVWVYYGTYGSWVGGGTYFDKYQITGTLQNNNKLFFKFSRRRIILTGIYSGSEVNLFNDTASIRIDSVNLNVYKNKPCNSNPFLIVDSLLSKKNDSANTCSFWGTRNRCVDTSIVKIFLMSKKSKQFYIQGFEGYEEQRFAKDFGVVYYRYGQHGEGATYNLKGCIINGIIYGDTSLTGIYKISSEIPEKFSLFQNYPNPFNPITKIKFAVPLDSRLRGNDKVWLRIYDILGREVQTLVNEQLSPGTYEVEWDGSNFSSGVYYYTLTVIDASAQLLKAGSTSYFETKKMVLIK